MTRNGKIARLPEIRQNLRRMDLRKSGLVKCPGFWFAGNRSARKDW
jgi:hypothetical protein